MQTPVQIPPFLRGDVEGVPLVVSVWLRNLEEVEEIVAKWASDLSPEGFWWVPAPGTNPIGGLVRHIGGSSYRLMLRGTGQEVPEAIRIRPAEEMAPTGRDTQEVLAQFAEDIAKTKAALRTLQMSDLERVVKFVQYEVKAAYILDHIAGHALQHAGQIITTRKLWDAHQT